MSRLPQHRPSDGITRRRLLIGGGAGVGLLVAWAAWPRSYRPNATVGEGERLFGPYLKIGEDGRVTVFSPQVEMGQGVYTTLPQLVADELGADWRQVAVEPAPISPLYANRLYGRELAEAVFPAAAGVAETWATRSALMVTAGSTAARGFELPMREAGAAARALLCMAAAARWETSWESLDAVGGFVVGEGDRRLRFGELAAEAATLTPPPVPPVRVTTENRLTGQSLPRLDLPSKVDGSALYAGDVRLPDMIFASVRAAPFGGVLDFVDKEAADRVRGVVAVIETPGFVAAAATNWWAANQGLEALKPRFRSAGRLVDDAVIGRALTDALAAEGHRIEERGDPDGALDGQQIFAASYGVAPALHAAIEPMCATAHWSADRLDLWLPTQAPESARRAAAAAIGVGEGQVTVYPTLIGGSFGRKLENDAAVQAAILAQRLKRPVQLTWARVEDLAQDRPRAPAEARVEARLGAGGRIQAWRTRIAAPASGHQIAQRLIGAAGRLVGDGSDGDRAAVDGAVPPYAIPAIAVDHHVADIGVPVGDWRGNAASYTCFFTEAFVDELAAAAGADPFSYRIQMLGNAPRLARCLSTVATTGGWQGGGPGSGQGLACFAGWGSFIAVMAEAGLEGNRVRVSRIAAVADVGAAINPDIVRQQIEGALIWGVAAVRGVAAGYTQNLGTARRLGAIGLPTLADSPEISVELLRSDEAPGGASELGVPPVAPAVAGALFTATGRRFRRLPIDLSA